MLGLGFTCSVILMTAKNFCDPFVALEVSFSKAVHLGCHQLRSVLTKLSALIDDFFFFFLVVCKGPRSPSLSYMTLHVCLPLKLIYWLGPIYDICDMMAKSDSTWRITSSRISYRYYYCIKLSVVDCY